MGVRLNKISYAEGDEGVVRKLQGRMSFRCKCAMRAD